MSGLCRFAGPGNRADVLAPPSVQTPVVDRRRGPARVPCFLSGRRSPHRSEQQSERLSPGFASRLHRIAGTLLLVAVCSHRVRPVWTQWPVAAGWGSAASAALAPAVAQLSLLRWG